jgi:hypothetical protein
MLITVGVLASLGATLTAIHAPAARRAPRRSSTHHSPPFKYVDASKAVPDASVNGDGVTSSIMPCPESHVNPVGAGAELNGDELSLDLELHSVTVDQSLQAAILEANNSSGSPASMVRHAICARGPIRYVQHESDFGPGVVTDVSVSCPLHTKVVGGGVEARELQPDPLRHQTEVGDTRPADGQDANSKPDDGWTATITNEPNVDTLVTVTAACARHGTYTVVSSDQKPLPSNHQASTTARCPRHSALASGGITITNNDPDLEVAGSFPVGGGRHGDPNGWRGVANNQSADTEHTRAWAVCKT